MDKVKMFADYLVKKPGDRFAMYSLALELKKAERFDEAETAFVALLEAHPQSGAGHYQHGLLLKERGQLERAQSVWEAGLAALRGTTDPEGRRSIGEIQQSLDEIEDDLD